MRILFIVSTPRAGTLQYTHNLANAMADRGHQVGLATSLDYEAKTLPKRYHPMEVFDRFRPRPIRIARFLRYVRSVRPQIIHFQGGQQPKAYLMLCRLLRAISDATLVYTPQEMLPFRMQEKDIATVSKLYAQMRHVFVNARQNMDIAVDTFGADPARTTVLPLADLGAATRELAAPEPPDIPADRKLALCFGLIEPRKGIGTLIDSFPAVLEREPSAYLAIVGKPMMDIAPYQQQIEQLGLTASARLVPDYVSFEAMAGYFERAELVVLPYEIGWNSGVLANAFGAGKPVVATDIGGFDEVVTDGANGLLVPPSDAPALADAMARMLGDEGFRATLAEGARKTADENSWSAIAAKTEQVYGQVLADGRT